MNTLLIICAALLSKPPAPSARDLILRALKNDPVGILGDVYPSGDDEILGLPLRVHDFATGKDLMSIVIPGSTHIHCNECQASLSAGTLTLFGGPSARNAQYAIVNITGACEESAIFRDFPISGGAVISMLHSRSGIAELLVGPKVKTASRNGKAAWTSDLTQFESTDGGLAQQALWSISAHGDRFAIAMGGPYANPLGGLRTAHFYVGTVGGLVQPHQGVVAGFVPKSDGGWIALLADGKCVNYSLSSNGVLTEANQVHRVHAALNALTGIYDAENKVLYDTTSNDRLAWVSFKKIGRPAIGYVRIQDGRSGRLATYPGSKWISISAIEQITPNQVRANVVWFKKDVFGKPVYKFTAHLEPGEGFLPLTDPSVHTAY